jgi:hypothetical protein
MEISQGNSLCSDLYLKQKCHAFLSLFSLQQNLRTREQSRSCPWYRAGSVVTGGRGKMMKKEVGG